MSKMILATNNNKGLGYKNTIPWHSSADFKHFKEETTGKIVVMGFKTWKSLPRKPLIGRLNIVLVSKDYNYNNRDVDDKSPSVLFLPEDSMWHIISNNPDCVIIGGARIYRLALPFVDEVVLSTINDDSECDTFFDLEKEMDYPKRTVSRTKFLEDGTKVEYWR